MDDRKFPLAFFLITLALMFFALGFRVNAAAGSDLFNPSFYCEDGYIFVNEAHKLGIVSIVTPYAGYLHLIPRLTAYAATFAPLSETPLLFHVVWILLFALFAYVMQTRLASIGVPPLVQGLAMVLLVVQPQAGEVFFTVTNIQWLAGLALATYLIFPFKERPGIGQALLTAAVGLTGPFGMLVLPILAVRALAFKDLKQAWPVYLAVIISAVIQAGFIAFSPKILNTAPSGELSVWLSAIIKFLSFGGEYPLATVFAFVFWASIPWHQVFTDLYARVKDPAGVPTTQQVASICTGMLVVVAFGFMAVGFLRDYPTSMSPVISATGVSGGSRYYFIPYSLLILAATVSTFRSYPRMLCALGAFSIICAANFVKPERINFQWDAYVKFARVTPDLVIPTGYRADQVPGWSVNAGGLFEGDTDAMGISIPLDAVSIENGEAMKIDGKTVVKSTSDNFSVNFPIEQCGSSSAVGVEVSGVRSYAGWIQVLGGRDRNFDDRNSVLRFNYPGEFTEKFAFTRDLNQNTVKVRPGFVPGEAEIRAIKVFCLK